jgi:LDH2 family malate/lactate/ureidoglycolate dehydrogenase
MADYFLWVELHDLPFVGARRIPELVERVRAGGSRIGSTFELIRDRPGFAVADAGDTLAQLWVEPCGSIDIRLRYRVATHPARV